jgi:transposase
MAMGQRAGEQHEPLWIGTSHLVDSPGHPFYHRLNELLREHGFDRFAEELCQGFYAPKMGRPSIPPGVYFRCLMIGYFEGIDSERGIAWRCADSLSLRRFLGIGLEEQTPDHSTISRTRRLIDLETHAQVFTWVLKVIAEQGLVRGKTICVDATTMEANAALRSIVRRDTKESYEAFLTRLAKASGIKTPTRDDLKKLDRKRPGKGSNDDWEHPGDPDAKIVKMKDGRTHLAHKVEHAVDLETGAVVAVTVQPAHAGDTKTFPETTREAIGRLEEVKDDATVSDRINDTVAEELVLDKGGHSNQVLLDLEELGIRSYVSEPDRGRRKWKGKARQQSAVYANRRRVRGDRGRRLMKKRGELVERSFAHTLDTGATRRAHLRGHDNIRKRQLIHVAAFDLGLLMRKLTGLGTPRGVQGRLAAALETLLGLIRSAHRPLREMVACFIVCWVPAALRAIRRTTVRGHIALPTSATGC